MNRGYIKQWRKSIDSPLFKNAVAWTLWCYLLLRASHKPHRQLVGQQIVELAPGQLVTGRKALADSLGLSERKIRTSLGLLVRLGNLTIKSTNKYSIITIENWGLYQNNGQQGDQQFDQQATSKGPTSGHKQEFQEHQEHIIPSLSQDPKSVTQPPASEGERGMGIAPVRSSSSQAPRPPQQPPDFSIEFLQFMDAFGEDPNDGAWSAWGAVCRRRDFPGLNPLLTHMSEWQESDQWSKDNGQFRPSAENYLRKGYWQRRPPKPVESDPYAYLLKEDCA